MRILRTGGGAVTGSALGRGYPSARRLWLWARQAAPGRERRRLRTVTRFVREYGLTVRGGPFAGMRYVEEAVGPVLNLVPRLLGAYERELHEVIGEAISEGPERVVNVGSADGYYAIGLAMRLPGVTVDAFESDQFMRSLCARVARENGVSKRVRLGPACDTSRLISVGPSAAFVLIDCEGCELALLRRDAVHALRTTKLLVELHELVDPDAADRLAERFGDTHRMRLIEPEPRRAGDYVELRGLEPDDSALAVSEFRPASIRWALLEPLARASTSVPTGDEFGRARRS